MPLWILKSWLKLEKGELAMSKKATFMQKSIPLFISKCGLGSKELKPLLKGILTNEELKPLSREEIKQLMKNYKGRVRIFLTSNLDGDLIEFFKNSPKSLQFALFKLLSEKLQEVKQ